MLRWRLSVGLITLMALLLAVGVYAVWLFDSLGVAIQRVLENNYQNIAVVHEVRTSVIQTNVTYLRVNNGPVLSGDKDLFINNRIHVEESLKRLDTHAANPEDKNLATRLHATMHGYFELYDQLFKTSPQDHAALAVIQQRIVDTTLLITEITEQILHLNEQAMLTADQTAQHKSRDSIHFMILAMIVALIVGMYASYRLGKSLLEPIHLLTDFAGRIGEGQLEITAPVLSEDELGKLASSFNNMAVQLRAYRQTTTERIFNLHRTMEATLATFPDPIFVLDKENKITLRNPAAVQFCEELNFHEALPPELLEKVTAVMESGVDYLPATFQDAIYYRIADQEKSFLPRVLAMRAQDDQIQGTAVVIQDITRFRLLDDVKTNLISTVSHELRTPLTSIRMVLHILLEKKIGPLSPKQDDLLGVAKEDSERLLRTLNDLLDLSRLEDAAQNLHYESIRPNDIVEEVMGEMSELAGRRQIKMVTQFEASLPFLPMDRLRMKHVLFHFLDNAIQHSPAKGIVQVKVRRVDGHLVRFSVTDLGEGVAPEYQGRIFDKFFRVPGQPKIGAGLGLSIARQIVQAHQGRIGVISTPGQGSEFYCDLPIDGKKEELNIELTNP